MKGDGTVLADPTDRAADLTSGNEFELVQTARVTFAEATQADMNWFGVLAHHATRTPDKAIAVFDGTTTSYGEMAARAAAAAAGLSERGIGRGELPAFIRAGRSAGR
jgi:non-ribosomal peptide synthetase component E (peptide arylation enzyme)